MFASMLLVYNEEEMLPRCLTFLDSLPLLSEICIVVDSKTNDNSMNIINDIRSKSSKIWKVEVREFKNFSEQRNFCLSLTAQPWILYIDADETYSQNIEELMAFLTTGFSNNFNAVRIPTLVMANNDKTIINKGNLDPHIRIFRNGFASYSRDVHEHLIDAKGRVLHDCRDSDIMDTLTTQFKYVVMKHFQALKSDKALTGKGERWEELGMLEASKKAGITISKDFWMNVKHSEIPNSELLVLHEIFYDVTTGKI